MIDIWSIEVHPLIGGLISAFTALTVLLWDRLR